MTDRFSTFAIVLLCTVSLASCTSAFSSATANSPRQKHTVTLRVVGADNMASLMRCWTDAFEAQQATVQVDYTAALSADGARAMIERRAELSPFAREYFPSEVSMFRSAFGTSPVLIPVAVGSFSNPGKTHALAIYVNRDNPLETLTVPQLRRVFAGNEELRWGDFGLGGEWSDAPVRTYGMSNLRASGNPPGIVNFLRHRLNTGQPLNDSIDQMQGDADRHALQQIVDAVTDDRFGIGYSGFGFTNGGSKSLKLTDTNDVTVAASTSTVAEFQYPLSRLIYIAIRPDTAPHETVAVTDFLHFVLGPSGQACVSTDASGFFALPPEEIVDARNKVGRLGSSPFGVTLDDGVSYVTENGKIRIVGYNDMDQILTSINDRFRERYPEIEFELDLRGTRTAPPALADGSSALAPMGAEFSEDQLEHYRQRVGADPVAIKIAHASLSTTALSGPLAFFVHASNPLNSISIDEARRLFTQPIGPDTIVRWEQLGVGAPWGGRAIQPCGLTAQTALASYLSKRKFGNNSYSDRVVGFGQSSDAVNFAADNPDAMCFAAFNRRSPGVKALAVAASSDEPAIEITRENIISGHYPLDRYLYIYLRISPDHGIDPFVREYLEFVLSPTGQAIIEASAREYLPLNPNEVREELAKLSLP